MPKQKDACVGGAAVQSVQDYCATGYEGPCEYESTSQRLVDHSYCSSLTLRQHFDARHVPHPFLAITTTFRVGLDFFPSSRSA